MKQYEIGIILNPDLDEAGLSALTEKGDGWVASMGGVVEQTEQKQKRLLAYPVRKKHEGHYVFLYARLPVDGSREIERNLRLTEDVLRFMVIRNDYPPPSNPDPVRDQEVLEANQDEGTSDDEGVREE